MACVCRRYNARSDWLIVTESGRLRACVRTIGREVITSAALALAFLLYFCVPYNKQLNNLDCSAVTGKSQTSAYRTIVSRTFSFEQKHWKF